MRNIKFSSVICRCVTLTPVSAFTDHLSLVIPLPHCWRPECPIPHPHLKPFVPPGTTIGDVIGCEHRGPMQLHYCEPSEWLLLQPSACGPKRALLELYDDRGDNCWPALSMKPCNCLLIFGTDSHRDLLMPAPFWGNDVILDTNGSPQPFSSQDCCSRQWPRPMARQNVADCVTGAPSCCVQSIREIKRPSPIAALWRSTTVNLERVCSRKMEKLWNFNEQEV